MRRITFGCRLLMHSFQSTNSASPALTVLCNQLHDINAKEAMVLSSTANLCNVSVSFSLKKRGSGLNLSIVCVEHLVWMKLIQHLLHLVSCPPMKITLRRTHRNRIIGKQMDGISSSFLQKIHHLRCQNRLLNGL